MRTASLRGVRRRAGRRGREVRRRRVGAHRRGLAARAPGGGDRRASSASWPARSAGPSPTGSSPAVERATAAGLPLVAAPVSGGTRMQEGTPAFVQMVRISQAVAAHKAAGLPYLVYLRHPTTGGVMASWGSLGPRDRRRARRAGRASWARASTPRSTARSSPRACRPSENLYARGIIDAVVAPEDIPDILDRALSVLMAPRSGVAAVPEPRRRARPRRRDVGRRHPLAAPRPARRTPPAEVRRRRRRPAQRHRPGRAGPRACSSRWRGSGRRRACSSARTGAARPPTTRWARRRCARPAAASGSPPSWACRWSP